MSKEKEIVLTFRDLLTRTNKMADAAEKTPIDIEFIKAEAETYKEKEVEYKELLSLPADEVTDNFMFKMIYGGFSEVMLNLVTLVGLYYNNLQLFFDKDEEKLKETIEELGDFRNQCNKRFKKVEKQLSKMGHVD